MPKRPMLSIPLDLPDVRVLKTELTNQGELIITVESTLSTVMLVLRAHLWVVRCGRPRWIWSRPRSWASMIVAR